MAIWRLFVLDAWLHVCSNPSRETSAENGDDVWGVALPCGLRLLSFAATSSPPPPPLLLLREAPVSFCTTWKNASAKDISGLAAPPPPKKKKAQLRGYGKSTTLKAKSCMVCIGGKAARGKEEEEEKEVGVVVVVVVVAVVVVAVLVCSVVVVVITKKTKSNRITNTGGNKN